jgi:hypothetical protein
MNGPRGEAAGGAWPVLRHSDVGHRCRKQSERANDQPDEWSDDRWCAIDLFLVEFQFRTDLDGESPSSPRPVLIWVLIVSMQIIRTAGGHHQDLCSSGEER